MSRIANWTVHLEAFNKSPTWKMSLSGNIFCSLLMFVALYLIVGAMLYQSEGTIFVAYSEGEYGIFAILSALLGIGWSYTTIDACIRVILGKETSKDADVLRAHPITRFLTALPVRSAFNRKYEEALRQYQN